MFTDSWGLCIAGVTSVSVSLGFFGSDMSSTATPVTSPARLSALVGNSRAVS